jgi:hypothetical protein
MVPAPGREAAMTNAGESKKTAKATANNNPKSTVSAAGRSAYNRPARDQKQDNDSKPVARTHNRKKPAHSRREIPDELAKNKMPAAETGMQKIAVNAVLDFTPRVKTGVVAEMTKRIPRNPLILVFNIGLSADRIV